MPNACLQGTRRAILQAVKYFARDDAKNAKLKADRGIGFEDVVFRIMPEFTSVAPPERA
jgi:hypothetical protein